MPRSKPLAGKIVVVTRPRARSERLLSLLADRGARGISVPMLAFEPGDSQGLARAARRMEAGEYGWAFFTSASGVAASRELLASAARGARRPGGVQVAAVGPATAAALRKAGCRVRLIPDRHTSAALLSVWKGCIGTGTRGARVLLLQPDIAPPDLARGLRRAGASVDQVVAYRTRGLARLPRAFLRLARSRRVDWVVFTSPSTAVHLARSLVRAGLSARDFPVATIGPVTTRAARRLGFRVLAESPDQTERGIVRAVIRADARTGDRSQKTGVRRRKQRR